MLLRCVILCLLIAMGKAWAFDAQMRQAEVYFEAKDFSRALSQYELLQGDHLPVWQRGIIDYDIGTVFLAQRQWDHALSSFEQAARDSPMPLVKQYLSINSALARLGIVHEDIKKIHSSSKIDDEDYRIPLHLLRQTLEDLDVAEKAGCTVALTKGAKECPSELAIQEVRRIADIYLGIVSRQYQNYQILILSQQGAVTEKSLKLALQHLDEYYQWSLGDLQDDSLSFLVYNLKEIQAHLSQEIPAQISEDLLQVQALLDKSRVALLAGKPILAHILLEVSYAMFVQAQQQFTSPSNQNAEAILKNALRDQQLALKINRLLKQAAGVETIPEENGDLALKYQMLAIQAIQKFNEAALQQQKNEFESRKQNQLPWNDILALVRDGAQEAMKAHELLTHHSHFEEATGFQETTIKKWKLALDKFHLGITEQQEPSPESEKESKESTSSIEQDKSLTDILKAMQEMENDDRSQPVFKSVPEAEGEKRPW